MVDMCDVTGKPCARCGKSLPYATDYYMVHDGLWCMAWKSTFRGKRPAKRGELPEGQLCIACLERAIERPLTQRDFTDCPLNAGTFGFDLGRFPP